MTDENWSAFKQEFKKEHNIFYESLMENFPELKESHTMEKFREGRLKQNLRRLLF